MTIEVNVKLVLAKQQLREWHHQQYVAENNVKIAKRIDDSGMKDGGIALLKRCEAAIDFLNEEITALEKEQ